MMLFLHSQVKTNLNTEALMRMKRRSSVLWQLGQLGRWGRRRRGKQPGLIRYALSFGNLLDGPQRLIVALDQKSLADLHPVSGGDHLGANAKAGVFNISVELIFTYLQLSALAYEGSKGCDDLIGQMVLIAVELITIFSPFHSVFSQSRDLSCDQQSRELETSVAQTNVRVGDLDDHIRRDASSVALHVRRSRLRI